LIFHERHTCLLPYNEEITSTLNFKLDNLSEEDQAISSGHIDELIEQLNAWSAAALREEKANKPGFLKIQQSFRHMQMAPSDIQQKIKDIADNGTLKNVYNGLICGTFNWFTSLKGNNTQPMRLRYVKSLVEEVKHHRQFRKSLLKKVPQLYHFRDQILDIIHNTVGLENFQTWTRFMAPVKPVKLLTYNDTLVAQNILAIESEHLTCQLDKVFQSLVNGLSKAGILGVKVEDTENEYKVHPAMLDVIKTAYKVRVNVKNYATN
jgi:hypothetical protein